MWSLYKNNQPLEPLKFSNNKSQKDVVEEVIQAVKQGYKIIFIKGMCGTGKSAVALNLARNLGKTSIVVPIKSLQEQYTKDYTHDFYVLNKNNKEKLKIFSIFGRQNFKCKFLEENKIYQQKNFQEKNAKLNDIFQGINPIKDTKKDDSCDNIYLPCKIEIKEKNISIIKDYIRQNPNTKLSNFDSINQIRRMTIAPICPYWSPILSDEFDIKIFKNSEKIHYLGLRNKQFAIYQRKPGCLYYEQYFAYANADVLIFNSLKYKLETLMDRKPQTEIEIIDECDEFLDSFANQEKINLNRLSFSLTNIFPENEKTQTIIDKLIDITNTIKRKYKDKETSEILEINNTLIKELLLIILKNPEFLYEIETDESNYIYHLEEVAKIFDGLLNETYFSINKEDRDLVINLVTTNLEKRFKELIEKNKVIIMMSGTIHSEKVLKNIFGLENFKIIEAEIQQQGNLIPCKHGYEIDCKYANFQSNKVSRKKYLQTFSKTIACAKPPILVHLTSFSDLPTDFEKQEFNIFNLPPRQELIKEQNQDPFGKRILDFKNKKTNILFTTKCTRGMDFPGETCNSIIISRFPYPNISSIFWKILKKTNPEHFMSFYMDKANRELLQRIYRGLRSKNDKIYLLSPDIRVLDFKIK